MDDSPYPLIILGPSFYGDIWADLQSTLNFTYTMVNTLHKTYKIHEAKTFYKLDWIER